jgi:hypothetical protein
VRSGGEGIPVNLLHLLETAKEFSGSANSFNGSAHPVFTTACLHWSFASGHLWSSLNREAGDYCNVWLAFLAEARRNRSGAFMRSQVCLKSSAAPLHSKSSMELNTGTSSAKAGFYWLQLIAKLKSKSNSFGTRNKNPLLLFTLRLRKPASFANRAISAVRESYTFSSPVESGWMFSS